MKEKKMNFNEMVYGDICQRSMHSSNMDEDIEDFEQEILSALEEEEHVLVIE